MLKFSNYFQGKVYFKHLSLFQIHLSSKMLYYLSNRFLMKRKFCMLSFTLNTFQHRCSFQSQGNRGYKEFCNMKLVHHPLEENENTLSVFIQLRITFQISNICFMQCLKQYPKLLSHISLKILSVHTPHGTYLQCL